MTNVRKRAVAVLLVLAAVAIGVLFAGLPPAGAATCATGSIDWSDGPALIRTGETDGVKFDIVGTFLWVQIDDGQVVSTELDSEHVGFSACDDGTVELESQIAPGPAPKVTPRPVIVVLPDVWRQPMPAGELVPV